MKTLITILICCLTCTYSFGQSITLSFENPQIINEVDDDFYQVDVFIQSDTDFILGPGQFFIDYNEAAFGSEISINGDLSFEQPDGSILASSSFSVGNYNNFNTNDSGLTRASLNWLQFWSSGTIATNNVGMAPAFLGRIRIRFADSMVNPDVCFNTEDPRDDQFFTACGPFTPAPAGADCAGEIGNQLFNYTPDCSGSALPVLACSGETTTYTIAGGWDNGTPDETMIAVIAEDYNTATMGLGDINACELTVNAMATLTVADGNFVNIQNDITIDGTLTVDHQGSVVQVEEDAVTINNGSISVSKTTPTIDDRNFVAMSSPVTAEARDRVYGNSRAVFSIIPDNFVPFPIDLMTFPEFEGAENFLDDDNDYLLPITGSTALPTAGIGQLIFPQPMPDVGDGAYTLTYTQNPSNPGTLNSGTITVPIHYNGPATINNYNLLGNPYASAIDIMEFISTNDAVNEVYFWDHLTNPTSALPGFGTSNFSMNDISMRNTMMGVMAVNGGTIPGQFMASGQGFGIKADQGEMIANTPVVFTNRIRVTGNNDGFRSSDVESNLDKLWLNLTTAGYEEAQSQTGIGFTEHATQGYDPGYDSKRLGTFLSLFTNLDGDYLAIQGREAFDPTIELTLGFSTSVETEETYTIRMDHLEGVAIENAPIFLIDHLENTMTNLKENSYSFTASKGIQSDRFTVIFQERDVLGVDEIPFRESVTLYPNPATDLVTLTYTGQAQLQELTIIDMNGKLIKTMDLKNFSHSQNIQTNELAKGMYFIQIQSNRDVIVQKLIIK
jgi:hypothetical protein